MSRILAITRMIVADYRMRRKAMIGLLLCALVLLLGGVTVFEGALKDRPVLFALYWFGCAWITVAAALLAVFEMLLVHAAGRAERRRLERETLGEGSGE